MKLRRFTKNFDLLGGSRKKQYIGKNCLKGGLRQFVDLKGDLVKSRWEEGVFEGRGWYLNAHYETGNNFNCDINLLVPMSSLLISNRKVLSCYWLATNNNFWCRQELKMQVSDALFGQKTFSFGNLTHIVFFNKM